MKKFLITVIATLSLLAVPMGTVFATPAQGPFVNGNVYYNGKPITSPVGVTVSCETKGQATTKVTKSTTSSATGYYSVNFTGTTCNGSKAFISTTTTAYEGITGSSNTVEQNVNKNNTVSGLDIYLTKAEVPEFSVATITGAAIIGGGSLLLIRRRNLSAKAQ